MSSKKQNPAQRSGATAISAVRLVNGPAKSGNATGAKPVKPIAKATVAKSIRGKPVPRKLTPVKPASGKASHGKVAQGKGANVKAAQGKLAQGRIDLGKSGGSRTARPATVLANARPARGKLTKPAVGRQSVKATLGKPTKVKVTTEESDGDKTDARRSDIGKTERDRTVGAKPAVVRSSVANTAAIRTSSAKASTPKDQAGKASEAKKAVSEKRQAAPTKPHAGSAKSSPRSDAVARQIQDANEQRERQRDLSQPLIRVLGSESTPTEAVRDRVVLLVRDPYWLHASWEITRQSVQRAQAAMAEQWHSARPILRVFEVDNAGMTSSAERLLREIAIHGGVHNWYIDVQNPPRGFRVEIGYLSSLGKFFAIARSNIVSTPRPGSADSLDENWSDVEENYERIFAQSGGYSEETNSHELQEAFEERLQRPIGPPLASRFGVGAERILRRKRDFQFDVDAEMVVHGQTKPDAHVTLSGEPVKLRADGSFAVRMAMPDKRQVIPVVASSRDGVEQRTIVIAVERNTKVMEPMIRESNE